jgi:hypothetical protein
MTWIIKSFISEAGNLVQHIIPVEDIYEHELMPHCWCQPKIDRKDFLAIHNSWDEREKFETGERKKS